MGTVFVVQSGDAWGFKQPPCSKGMIPHLERNEALVTWVQPKGGGCTDQFPVMRVGDKYYTMSLRMMKAVWSVSVVVVVQDLLCVTRPPPPPFFQAECAAS